MWLQLTPLLLLLHHLVCCAAAPARPPNTMTWLMLRRACSSCFCGGGRGQAILRAHALPLRASSQSRSKTQIPSGRTFATSPSSPFSTLQDDLKAILSKQLVPVGRIDVDAERFLARANFRNFVLARFDIGTLEAQGEESSVRRIVHAHLVGPEADSPLYRQLLASLSTLPDPWAPAFEQSQFQMDMAKITTSSQRSSHLVAATAGRAGITKALQQLNVNLETLRAEENKKKEAQEEESSGTDLIALRAKITDRQARVDEMEIKLARFDALIQVLAAIEERLTATKDRVMAEKRRRHTALNGSSSSSSSSSNNNNKPNGANNDVRRNSQAWGKAVEKEGKEALEACLEEWRKQQQQQQQQVQQQQQQGTASTTTTGMEPFVLTGVTLQSLDSETMQALRQDIVQRHAPIYDNTDWPKAELDALIVAPTLENSHHLQVLLAFEMKRSLDEVSVDCLKFHLSLELCRHAPPRSIRFSSSSSPSSSSLENMVKSKQNKSKNDPSEFSTDRGFVLDFSSLRLPDDAIYMTKRGGNTLRAVTKLLLEQVQLARSDSGGGGREGGREEEEEEEEVLRRFYAPDFVWEDEGAGRKAAAEKEREAVLEALFQRFSTRGIHRLWQRLEGVVMVLTGHSLSESKSNESPPPLRSVLALHKDLSA